MCIPTSANAMDCTPGGSPPVCPKWKPSSLSFNHTWNDFPPVLASSHTRKRSVNVVMRQGGGVICELVTCKTIAI